MCNVYYFIAMKDVPAGTVCDAWKGPREEREPRKVLPRQRAPSRRQKVLSRNQPQIIVMEGMDTPGAGCETRVRNDHVVCRSTVMVR